MKISIYKSLPDHAKEIRQKVFVQEQGFQNEFDEMDHIATHIVMYDEDEIPIATCRVYWDMVMEAYVFGRLAVVKEYRGKSIGSDLLKEAERYVQNAGGKNIVLHAQCRVVEFYRRLGFIEFGNKDYDEGCPHIWMKKTIR